MNVSNTNSLSTPQQQSTSGTGNGLLYSGPEQFYGRYGKLESPEYIITCQNNSKDCDKFYEYFSQNSKLIPYDSFDLVRFYNWFDNMQTPKRSLTKEYYSGGSCHMLKFRRARCDGTTEMVSIKGCGAKKKDQVYDIVRQLYGVTHFQMETPDGVVTQESDQASNTIMTSDMPVDSVNIPSETGITTQLCNTEDVYSMPQMTDRWEVLKSGVIADSKEGMVEDITIPKDLFSANKKNSANLQLFRSYVYSQMELEFRVVINCPKFGQGKILLSWFPDGADQVDWRYQDYRSMIQRPHVIIDMNATNQAEIKIPQIYRRSFIRNLPHETSHTGGQIGNMCKFQMAILSKYAHGPEQPTSFPYQIFYKFSKLEFHGMSYAVELQMDKVIGIAGELSPEVALAEKLLKRCGFIGNQDKPYLEQNTTIVPNPRRNFCSGEGISDAIPLTFSRQSTVTTLAEYMNDGDPNNFLDLAKKFGILGNFDWPQQKAAGEVLYEWNVSPTVRMTDTGVLKKIPTPIDYASSQFAFWRGTIDLKLLFVSTPYHTGTLQLEISYNRKAANLFDNASVYTKTFQLGEQRELDFKIPYIYDTPWRRTSTYVSWPRTPGASTAVPSGETLTQERQSMFADAFPMAMNFINNTNLTIRVINPLTPLQQVSNTVNVIVLIKAGDDFQLHGICPNFWSSLSGMHLGDTVGASGYNAKFHDFPIFDSSNGVATEPEFVVPRLKKPATYGKPHTVYRTDYSRETVVGAGGGEVLSQAKKKMARLPRNQITFQNEPTRNFNTGIKFKHFHSTDNEMSFKTLMRRNYLLGKFTVEKWASGKKELVTYYDNKLGKNVTLTYNTTSRFWLPCYLPSHQLSNDTAAGPLGSPISTIPTIFRHWRGSLRYTLVFHSSVGVINVSYVPNLGTMYFGNILQGHNFTGCSERVGEEFNDRVTTNTSLAALGFATELVICSINPTVSIMAPFDCMFNRCVNANRIILGNMSNAERVQAREEATQISGHIVIESKAEVSMSVYISAGDDLNLMNFIGTSEYESSVPSGLYDNYHRESQASKVVFQMEPSVVQNFSQDFHIKQPRSNTTVVFQMFSKFDNVADDATRAINNFDRKVDGMSETIDALIKNANSTLNLTNDRVGSLTDTIKLTTQAGNQLLGATEKVVNGVESRIDKMATEATNHINEIHNMFNSTGKKVDTALDTSNDILNLIKPMMERLNNLITSVCPENFNVIDQSKDFVLDLIVLIRNFDFTNFAIMFLKYISKIFTCDLSVLTTRATELAEIIKRSCGYSATEQISAEIPTTVSLFGFFMSLVMGLIGLKVNAKKEGAFDFQRESMNFVFDKRSPMYLNSIMTLVERVFRSFSGAINYLLGMKEVSPSVIEFLKENEMELARFCLEVDQLTDPANRSILTRPDIKAKLWHRYMYARAIRRQLSTCTGNSAAGVIMGYVNRICSLCQDEWSVLSNCPVRTQPRVILIYGESNIGKSHLIDALSIDLLKEIGYKCLGQNPVFTRAPGRKHWDGYSNQPCIRFDDWMNLMDSESVREQVSDLYELKSTCDFMPPMANLNQKGMRGNPHLVFLLTNTPFPTGTFDTLVPVKEAVWRRRDKMIQAKIRATWKDRALRDMTHEESATMAHLEFRFMSNVERDVPVDETWYSYTEMVSILQDDFVQHHRQEVKLAKIRLDKFSSDLPEFIRELSDPMDLLSFQTVDAMESTMSNPDFLPSKILETQIQECIAKIKDTKTFQMDPSPIEKFAEDRSKIQSAMRDWLNVMGMEDWTLNGRFIYRRVNGITEEYEIRTNGEFPTSHNFELVDKKKLADQIMPSGLTNGRERQLIEEFEKQTANTMKLYDILQEGVCNTCEFTVDDQQHSSHICMWEKINICPVCSNFETNDLIFKCEKQCMHILNSDAQGEKETHFWKRMSIVEQPDKYPIEKAQATSIKRVMRNGMWYKSLFDCAGKEEAIYVIDALEGEQWTYQEYVEFCAAHVDSLIPGGWKHETLRVPFTVEALFRKPCRQRLEDSFMEDFVNYRGLKQYRRHELKQTVFGGGHRDIEWIQQWFKKVDQLRGYNAFKSHLVEYGFHGRPERYTFHELKAKLESIDIRKLMTEEQHVEDYDWFMIPQGDGLLWDIGSACGEVEFDEFRVLSAYHPHNMNFDLEKMLNEEYLDKMWVAEEKIESREDRIVYLKHKYIRDILKDCGTQEEINGKLLLNLIPEFVGRNRTEFFDRRIIDERDDMPPGAAGLLWTIEEKDGRPGYTPEGKLLSNVFLDMGWSARNFPQEIIEEMNTTFVPLSKVRCDHCGKTSIFQFGDEKHHICHVCVEKQTKCDFCAIYPNVSRRFWMEPLKALWACPVQHYCTDKNMPEPNPWVHITFMALKAISTVIAMVILTKLLCLFLPTFVSFIGSFVALYMVKKYTGVSLAMWQDDKTFEFNPDYFKRMMNQRNNYDRENGGCKHDMFLSQAQVEYTNLRWRWGQIGINGKEISVSVFPCARNCCLFDYMEEYEYVCREFAENQLSIYRGAADRLRANPDDADWNQFYNTVPPFLRSIDLEYHDFKDAFEEELLCKYRAAWNRLLNGFLTTLSINPTWKWLKILAAVGGVLLGVVAALRGITSLWKWFRGDSAETQDNYDKAQMRHFKRAIQKPRYTKIVKQTDNEFFNSLVNKIFKNQFSICVMNGKQIIHEMCAVGIQHRVAILPKHYLRAMQDWSETEHTMYIRFPAYPDMIIHYPYDPVDFIEAPDTDLAIFNLPKTVNEFRDISSYIASPEDWTKPMPSTGSLVRATRIRDAGIVVKDLKVYGLEKTTEIEQSTGERVRLSDVLKYDYSEGGRCSSLILRPNSTRPIVAMHVAGTTPSSWNRFGFGVLLSSDTFDDIFINHKKTISNEHHDLEKDEIKAQMDLPPGCMVQKLFALEEKIHLPTKSKIIPSPLNEYDGKPQTQPVYLSAYAPGYEHDVSPLVAGCAKHGVLTMNFPTSVLDDVADALYNAKYRQMKPLLAEPKRLTIEETIRGFSMDGYDQMKLDTSMGYPFCLGKKKQKRDWIKITDHLINEERQVTIDPEVEQYLNEHLSARERGEYKFAPVTDNIKDERKKLAKIRVYGSTRVYCMSPLASTVSNRRNFLHFAAAYKNHRFLMQHGVGLSRNGPDWGTIANSLLSNGESIVTIDYSNFGPGYNAGVCAKAHDIVCAWTRQNVTGISEHELYILGEEHYNSIHIMGDLVYRQLSGGPSGDALTVVKNGLVNELYILLAWHYLYDEQDFPVPSSAKYQYFFDNVVLYTYGDDAIMSVSDQCIGWFNGETISAFFADYNIVATDAEKSGAIQKFKSIYEATFLKSGFTPHPTLPREWLAPLDMLSITECPRWIYKCEDIIAATEQNVDMALQLAYGHGREVYDDFREKLAKACVDHGLKPSLLTWDEIDEAAFKNYSRPLSKYRSRLSGERLDNLRWYLDYCEKRNLDWTQTPKEPEIDLK